MARATHRHCGHIEGTFLEDRLLLRRFTGFRHGRYATQSASCPPVTYPSLLCPSIPGRASQSSIPQRGPNSMNPAAPLTSHRQRTARPAPYTSTRMPWLLLNRYDTPARNPPVGLFPREDHKEPAKRKQERFDTRSWLVPCLVEAKITGYVWHCNRHTFRSWLAMAGATIKEIQELAGHKTITMSARYAHLSPDHKLAVLDRITGTATEKPNSHQNSHQPKTATR